MFYLFCCTILYQAESKIASVLGPFFPESLYSSVLYMIQVDVNGQNAAPIYKFLKSQKGGIFGDGIKWNFSKFLVDKDGHVVERYAPTTSPLSIEVMEMITFARF